MEFTFQNISSFLKKERVLNEISGSIISGNILAVIGHEVCGKTTLLTTLAGRHPLYDGEIAMNGSPLTYSEISTRVAFVPKQSFFLPTLTIRETLEYGGLLRLPQSLSKYDKMKKITEVERITALNEIAVNPVQFTSNFSQKCLAIACELLRDTPVIVIDEPFNGLLWKDCYKMHSILNSACEQLNRAIIISMATSLSYVIRCCSQILFLYHGQMVYNGHPERMSAFLTAAGMKPPENIPAAEFMMELLSDMGKQVNASQAPGDMLMRYRLTATNTICPKARNVSGQTRSFQPSTFEHELIIRETVLNGDFQEQTNDEKIHIESHSLLRPLQPEFRSDKLSVRTSYWNQIKVLTARNFHNARRRILFPVSIIQNMYVLVICVLIWWRPARSEETIKDRLGLFFFSVVQWAFFSLLDAILTFPKEKRVILEERSNHLYSTSAFCISKTLSEMLLTFVQPCVFMGIMYWVANLNSVISCFSSIGVMIIDVWAAQSIGLFVGISLNPPWTVSVVSLGMLSMMLLGGAFCTPPQWLSWGKYVSYFTYGMNAFISLEFQNAEPIRCGDKSMVPICNMTDPLTNLTVTHFPSEIILTVQQITWSVFDDVMVLLVIAIITRLLWYLVLRRS